MVKLFFIIGTLMLFFTGASTQSIADDDAIRKDVIKRSIRIFPSDCPCPFSLDENGRKCGMRSAYSNKLGGYTPVCYPHDITDEMLQSYKENALPD